MKERVSKKEWPKVEEKIRIVWPYGVYIPDLEVVSWLEKKYGAVTINFMNFNWVVKPPKIFRR